MKLKVMCGISGPAVLVTLTLLAACPVTHDETFYLDPISRRTLLQTELAFANVTARSGELSYLYAGIHYCPQNVRHSSRETSVGSTSEALQWTSSCPWYWTLNLDIHREPAMLLTAMCACRNCQDSSGFLGNQCQPVRYHRRVKYIRHKQSYGYKLFPIVVGCTCNRYFSYKARALP